MMIVCGIHVSEDRTIRVTSGERMRNILESPVTLFLEALGLHGQCI